jgi:uncharacterized protein involved in type VI secretion and phage assembly
MADSDSRRYYGKFRGTVLNNIDPMQIGRIMAMVPDVLGITPSTWAMPCVPVAGLQTGMYSVPIIGSGVWIEFEQGDADYPIWTGAFWGTAAEVPAIAKTIPPVINGFAVQTMLQNGMVLSDVPGPTGGFMIKSATGATLIVNDTGIYIQNGKGASIIMVGPSVTINQGAMVIT